jgi:hypothetical protein
MKSSSVESRQGVKIGLLSDQIHGQAEASFGGLTQPRDVRFWWNRFAPMLAAKIRKSPRRACARPSSTARWHLDEVFVNVNGKLC